MSQLGCPISVQTALATSVRNQCCPSSHPHSADPRGNPQAEAIQLLTAVSVPWRSSARPPTASLVLKSNEHLPALPGPCQLLTQNWHRDFFVSGKKTTRYLVVCSGLRKKGQSHLAPVCDFSPSFAMEGRRALPLASGGFPGTTGCYWPSVVRSGS